MSIADNLHRRLDVLEKALTLKKSGLPNRLVTLCYSEDPADIAQAERQTLQRYGISSKDVLQAAGTTNTVAVLPWAKGRGIGLTSNIDPRVPAGITVKSAGVSEDQEIPPVVGTLQHMEGFE